MLTPSCLNADGRCICHCCPSRESKWTCNCKWEWTLCLKTGCKCCLVCYSQSCPGLLRMPPYYEVPMPISRLRLLIQLCMGSHSLPVEQGRLARPAIPRHLRRCTFCNTGALGNERHLAFDCPHFAHVRRQFRSLFDDADGNMQLFFWHTNQKAV